jgi:hypothetical protein
MTGGFVEHVFWSKIVLVFIFLAVSKKTKQKVLAVDIFHSGLSRHTRSVTSLFFQVPVAYAECDTVCGFGPCPAKKSSKARRLVYLTSKVTAVDRIVVLDRRQNERASKFGEASSVWLSHMSFRVRRSSTLAEGLW